MVNLLNGKSILFGISGSIAAYKAIEVIRLLKKEGASVNVIMTDASRHFITPLSVEIASCNNVYSDMFRSPLSHISLTANADLFIIAPATANIIGKYANGIADDMLSTALLAYRGKVIFVPAMNYRMWENPMVQKNVDYLLSKGVIFIGPEKGCLACGEEGTGRMADADIIMEAIKTVFMKQDLSGQRIVVTAGPTREYLDPVRYISNRSSGRMGYAIARIAKMRGADVTLISGPVSLMPPYGVDLIKTETTEDMYRAVKEHIKDASLFIMSAAVSDYMFSRIEDFKIEKREKIDIELIKTKDILKEIGSLKETQYIVGFSAETGNRLDRARKKLSDKNIDMIVFNNVLKEGSGFDVETNEVVILYKDDKGNINEFPLPLMSKEEVASAMFDKIVELRKKAL